MLKPALRIIEFKVNGQQVSAAVEPRRSLLDCLRDDVHLKGTHAGCEHGVCGCCNVLVDGELLRSCLMLAVQADGAEVTTVEGLELAGGELNDLQQAFCDNHGLQCGYCTPGVLMTLTALLDENPSPSEEELKDAVSGNLCRCTGYQQILMSARQVIASRAR